MVLYSLDPTIVAAIYALIYHIKLYRCK